MEMTVDAVSFSIPEHFQRAIANLFMTTVNKNESAHHMTSCLEKEKARLFVQRTSKELRLYVLLSDGRSLLLLKVQSCENKVTLVTVTVSEGRLSKY